MREANGVDVLADNEGDLNPKVHEHETLGADLVGQDFDSVGHQETGPGKSVGDAKDPDEGEHSLPGSCVAVVLIGSGADSPGNETNQHGGCGGKEERATTDFVDHHGHGTADNQGQDGLTTIETKLAGGIGNADAVINVRGIVADERVAGPL